MISIEEIDSALTYHKLWKEHLLEAIEKGTSNFQVGIVRSDNSCQFGKWIYSLWEREKNNPEFLKMKQLHAEFHKTASEILELAINGKKKESLKFMQKGENFDKVSTELMLTLNNLYFLEQERNF